MKRRMRLVTGHWSLVAVLFTVFCLLFTALVHAGGVGTTGAQFLKIGAGSRPAAMGGAFAGIANDANGLCYNPAGLAYLEKTEVTLMYLMYLPGSAYQYLSAAFPMSKAGTFSVGVNRLSISEIEKRVTDTANPVSTVASSDLAATIGYSLKFSPGFSAGVGIKMISCQLPGQTTDSKSTSGFAADLGLMIKPNKQLGIGLAAQNLGSGIKFLNDTNPLPMNIKLGLGYQPVEPLTLGVDVNVPVESQIGVSLGAEYVLGLGSVSIPLRAGFQTGTDLFGLTVGAGVSINKAFGLDFAWLPDLSNYNHPYRRYISIL